MNPFQESAHYFPSDLSQTVYLDKYSRYRYDLGRREAWTETVDRAVDFLRELSKYRLSLEDYERIRDQMLHLRVMPSMRLLASAGESARRNNIALFNCAFLTLDSLQSFVEIMLLSMNGVGVGYSVESKYTEQLPYIWPTREWQRPSTVLVLDSTQGWCDALQEWLDLCFEGIPAELDTSLVRPAGSVLRTKGGRASGPEPLRAALYAIRAIIQSRQGLYLRPQDASDIACHIAAASIAGGVRRSALICLFDVDNPAMLAYKQGAFWEANPQRAYANISAVITDQTSNETVAGLMRIMATNGTGEPGIFNRSGVQRFAPARRKTAEFGTNPCAEVALRPFQTCNLSSAVCRAKDTLVDLIEKVEVATIIGTIQSMADYFPGFRQAWVDNQREERLLGVDLNGQMDCPMVQLPEVQALLATVAVETNARYAKLLGINQSAAVQTVKPSGNSSQLLGASSGLHARWSRYYVRNIRLNTHSPVRRLLAAQHVPMVPEVGQTPETANTWVVGFPVESPPVAIFRHDKSAIQQADYALQVRKCWCEHQPSVTIYYRPEELDDIIAWVATNRDALAGLSFLPTNDHVYDLAPYVEVTREGYELLAATFPAIDFSRVSDFEAEDLTTAAQEVACSAGSCETL